MKRAVLILLAAVALMAGMLMRDDPRPHVISTYHGDLRRSGLFIVPGLTWERARSIHLDTAFHAELSGQVHAQPLYWTSPRSHQALLIVATEENIVYALDAGSGRTVWKRELGPPVARASLACGDIFPLGITGTPVIDPASETLYLDAAVTRSEGPRHLVFALALKDGAVLRGWPVDVAEALAGQEPIFMAHVHNQRGALLILAGIVYVPFGGFFDCGIYHGTIVGISLSDPGKVTRWATRATGGGVWAPGGIASDDTSLFLATGNTFDATDWADGEAVIRLPADLRPSADKDDFFAPADWRSLDAEDSDLGGTTPMLIDVPAGAGLQRLVLALGKDGKAYLLDQGNLGGIGGALAVAKVSARGIYAAGTAYPMDDSVYVAFPASGTNCPKVESGKGLAVLAIRSGSPPALTTAWCAQVQGLGAPMVTTTDGKSNPIVWDLGAEGDNRLHAFKGDTGEVLFSGPERRLAGLHRFQTLIATQDRLYVGADGTVYAFAF